ncbi:O-antigen ligase family protein [Bradyrhizobium sp. LB11.1]|uniref:O-antigen ligase family protein n=1 Tax=Bradyrhizobium sp. LB11.1 TaxID=3156326 RepID=UPI00339AD842
MGRVSLNIPWSADLVASCLLFFVVASAPFPFGSTSNLAIAFWCVCLGAALIVAPTTALRRPHLWIIVGILILVAAYAGVLHEQLSDSPWIASYHPMWTQLGSLLDPPVAPSASIIKHEAFFALGAPLANILAVLLGLIVGASAQRARQMLLVIAVSGSLYAAYGVLSFLIDPTAILWRDKNAYLSSVTGTFINRNTAAAYFGSCAVAWILLILIDVRYRLPGRRFRWSNLSRDLTKISQGTLALKFTALLICVMAMFMTGSRAGVAVSLISMILVFVVFLRKDLPPRSGIWIALAAGILAALVLLELLGGRVTSRFDSQGLIDNGRLEGWKSSLLIIAHNPWFGTGMGTFQSAFPPFRSPDISIRGTWNAAHSTPLEVALEAGIPMALLLAAGWAIMIVVLARGVFSRKRDAYIPLAAVGIALLALLHSCVDFTLQIPGYSIPFFALFGAGLAQSFRSGERTGEPDAVAANAVPTCARDPESPKQSSFETLGL